MWVMCVFLLPIYDCLIQYNYGMLFINNTNSMVHYVYVCDTIAIDTIAICDTIAIDQLINNSLL